MQTAHTINAPCRDKKQPKASLYSAIKNPEMKTSQSLHNAAVHLGTSRQEQKRHSKD